MELEEMFSSLANMANLATVGTADLISISQIHVPSLDCKRCLVTTALSLVDCRDAILKVPVNAMPSDTSTNTTAATTISNSGNINNSTIASLATLSTPEQRKCACYLGHHPEWVAPCGDLCPAEVMFFLEGKYTAMRQENCGTGADEGGDLSNHSQSTYDNNATADFPQQELRQQKHSFSSASTHRFQARGSKMVLGLALLSICLRAIV